MATKNWTPNEKQVNFMAILEKAGTPISLKEIKALYGQEFKTGSINTLITKGKVNAEKVEVAYTQIKKFDFNGVIIEEETAKTCKLTRYSLVGFDYEANKTIPEEDTIVEEPTKEDEVADVVKLNGQEVDVQPDFDIESVNLDF